MNNETNLSEQRYTQGQKTANAKKKPRYVKNTGADKQHKWMMVTICMLSVILLACIILLFMLTGESSLVGTWDLDGVTAYRFDSENSGALILPSDEYPFAYTVEEDKIYVDMLFEGAKDAEYSYSVRGNKLTLTGGTETTKNTYVLTRVD